MSTWERVKDNVDRVQLPDKTIYVVGTAHVSKSSSDLVAEVIRDVKPSSVAVELCEARLKSLRNPDRWKNTNIVDVIRQGRTYVLLAQLMLASFQKRLGAKLNLQPGAEMLSALDEAERIEAQVTLADRDVSVTLKRTWSAIGFLGLMKLMYGVVRGLFVKAEITEAEIERLKSADALEELMREFSAALPQVRTALIDERDRYLAAKIRSSAGPVVVGVVGAAHVPGIMKWIEEDIDLSSIEVAPRKRLSTILIGWALPLTVIGGLVYSFIVAGSDAATDMFMAWFWITGFFGALGAAVACGHPLTVVTAFIAAPFASLNPFVAAGWVAGIVEAMIRKPRVSDLENIAEDMGSFRGVFRNHVSRTLLIVASTNIFVMIGMALGAKELLSIVSGVGLH